MADNTDITELIDELNTEQKQAVMHKDGPMLVLAGPGSGKTKVLTIRILYLILVRHCSAESILVITFSRKAAIEMKERFNRLSERRYPVVFGTFHSIFFEILRIERNYSLSSLLSERDQYNLIEDAVHRIGIKSPSDRQWYKDMISKISLIKNTGEHLLDEEGDFFENDEERLQFKRLYYEYIQLCKINVKLDFDDMLILCLHLFQNNAYILNKWRRYFKYILVDEFQDINNIQYNILKLLGGSNSNIFAVGDDDQSIYAFRGSNPRLMKQFMQDSENAKCINLKYNYRCAGNIIAVSDGLIRNNRMRIDRQRQICGNKKAGIVEIAEAENSIVQANYVADTIRYLIMDKLYSYSDFAVIYRSGHCSKMFEIVALQNQIPLDKKSTGINIFEIDEICIIIDYFLSSLNLANRSQIFNIINHPPRGISREALSFCNSDFLVKMKEYYNDNNDKLKILQKLENDLIYIRDLPAYAAFVYIINATGLINYFRINQSSALKKAGLDISELLDDFSSICKKYNTIEGLLGFIDSVKEADNTNSDKNELNYNNNDSNKVAVLTAHASKGLEYKVVFVIGLQEGLFPHNKNLHGESVEEERRLMYVAMTRAKERLYLCSIGMEHGKQRSRFIDEIMVNQSFIASYSSLSRNSSNASATASYSSSSSM